MRFKTLLTIGMLLAGITAAEAAPVAFEPLLTKGACQEWRDGQREPVWPSFEKIPNFQEHQIGAMTDEVYIGSLWAQQPKLNPDFKPDDHRMPYLEWFEKPANPNGCCMILVSGGSYQNCCDLGLIKIWREQFTKLGYQTVNFVYRTPRPKVLECHQSAWEDGQRAVRLVRSQAKARGFDPEKIGVIGMSAGGHLVTLLATSALTPAYAKIDALDDLPCHVNVCIAHAPAYNTATAAKGDPRPQDGTTFVPSVNPCFKFDEKTCPTCFLHGANDPYTPNGSTLCYRELRKRGVPAEVHLYAELGHGAHGFECALEFLNQIEFAGKLAPEEDQRDRFTDADTLKTEEEPLWPEGRMPGVDPNQKYAPSLIWHVPKKQTSKAVLVIVPGGRYDFCNVDGEGVPAARYFNGKGMTAVIVKYRCPRPTGRPKHESAWQDAQRAIRLVRSAAPARGLDPDKIGLMGFSAGGHLALMTAVNSRTRASEPVDEIDEVSCKVNWAVPIYPAYVLTDGVDQPNTTGGNDDSAVIVPELTFDADTPPMCFIHGDADGWSAMNSVKCWEKLRMMGLQSDLHTLAKRGHCFQMNASPGTGSYMWLDRVWKFLCRKRLN